MLGRLPHDPLVTKAMVQGLVVTELPESDFSRKLGQTWSRIAALAGLGRHERLREEKILMPGEAR